MSGLTDVQLEMRRNRIGASDVAAILGFSKWTSPYTAWLRITGQDNDFEDNAAMEMGRDLESGLVDNLARRLGSPKYEMPGTLVNPYWPWWIATPDVLFPEAKQGGEIKVRGFHMTSEFQGRPGDGGEWDNEIVPLADVMQCQWNMAVVDYKEWWFCPYFGGADFRLYRIRYDEDLTGIMAKVALKWWKDHVDQAGPQEPPPVDGHPATAEHLKKLYPRDDGNFLPANERHFKLANEYRDLTSKIKEMELARDERKNLLIEAVGDAKGIEGVCNHTYVARKATVDFKGLAQSYPDWEERQKDHMKPGTGYRRFTLTKEKE